jgi:hypothetical protein
MPFRYIPPVLPVLFLCAAGDAQQASPTASAALERSPFALSLVIVDLNNSISQAVLPLSYPDRTSCELAGVQWRYDVFAGGVHPANIFPVCVPRVADLDARLARKNGVTASPTQNRP